MSCIFHSEEVFLVNHRASINLPGRLVYKPSIQTGNNLLLAKPAPGFSAHVKCKELCVCFRQFFILRPYIFLDIPRGKYQLQVCSCMVFPSVES